jgi:hypothetical protein
MEHVLKIGSPDRAGQQAAYTISDLPLATGLADRIAEFVRRPAH